MAGNQAFRNIIFRSEDDNYQRQQFVRFQQRGVTSTRYPDSTCLQQLGLLQGIEWMLRLADLTFLCTHNQPTYPSLTLEFLSSYAYNTPTGEDEFLTGTATFRMFNTEYSLSQNQLSTMLQFPIEGQVYPRIPPNLNWNTVAAFDLFRKISGVDANNWEELLVSHIHNPTIRYFIRILQNTVFGRPNNSKVNAKELFFLECVFKPNAKVNAASFLFHHIRTLCARGRQPFVIGGLITTIALGLNLGDRLQTLESLPPLFMDISYCRSSRLIKNRVGGKYYLMVNNQAVPSVVLPNIALTDVTNPNHHLYDLNAPEATDPSHANPSTDEFDEMEHGDQIPAQQSVPLNPSDNAAGSSSRRRRRRRPATNDDIMDAIDGGLFEAQVKKEEKEVQKGMKRTKYQKPKPSPKSTGAVPVTSVTKAVTSVTLYTVLRESPAGGGDVLGPSNPQTPGVNQQRGLGPHVQVARGCGTGGWLGHPGQ
ncbi:hypothetical protein KIW84_050721 [Lathyrus oleraceus]|uniref:Arabidopsis retrotransposon Orf1 C-terminal domain-containing protein n=1 Tax=Pisum sativum TaxID=3888 RepID=A0A9D4WKN3_PEA|nr:hypothetical protein KIW84_050721 [Pisum sativum]